MEHMKTKMMGWALAFCFLAGPVCFGADPQMGTWKLNAAKSKVTSGTLKYTTVTVKSMLGKVNVVGNGIDADGKPRAQRVDWQLRWERLQSYGGPDRRHSVLH
jgi:hypothetical protein